MNTEQILEAIDNELSRLNKVKRLLGSDETNSRSSGQSKRRTMSAEGRSRIAAAQKARWAKLKKK